MYFIRCPRHSPTKTMFYIKFLMASSSMTSVEEEADDRECTRRPELCDTVERTAVPREVCLGAPVSSPDEEEGRIRRR